jgi:protein arginine N-methyltransferase 3
MTTSLPMAEEQMSASGGSETSDVLSLKYDEGWEDVEHEEDQEKIVSLLDHEVFPNVTAMLAHCKEKYNFDFLKIRDNFALDFYGSIRLINYIRSEIKSGRPVSSNISLMDFEAEEFLKPVLEDDALLFNLGDLPEVGLGQKSVNLDYAGVNGTTRLLTRVAELEEELQKTQSQFSDYRSTVIQTLDERWKDSSVGTDSNISNGVKEEKCDDDSHYFSSYSYNGMSP